MKILKAVNLLASVPPQSLKRRTIPPYIILLMREFPIPIIATKHLGDNLHPSRNHVLRCASLQSPTVCLTWLTEHTLEPITWTMPVLLNLQAGIGWHKTFQNMKLSKPSGSGDLTYKSCKGLLNDQNTCRNDCKWWTHEILRKHLRRWQRQWFKLVSRRKRSGETPFWLCLGKHVPTWWPIGNRYMTCESVCHEFTSAMGGKFSSAVKVLLVLATLCKKTSFVAVVVWTLVMHAVLLSCLFLCWGQIIMRTGRMLKSC